MRCRCWCWRQVSFAAFPPLPRHGVQVVEANAVPLLVLAAQEPELGLRRVAASALADIAKHLPELAQAVVDAGKCLTNVLALCSKFTLLSPHRSISPDCTQLSFAFGASHGLKLECHDASKHLVTWCVW